MRRLLSRIDHKGTLEMEEDQANLYETENFAERGVFDKNGDGFEVSDDSSQESKDVSEGSTDESQGSENLVEQTDEDEYRESEEDVDDEEDCFELSQEDSLDGGSD